VRARTGEKDNKRHPWRAALSVLLAAAALALIAVGIASKQLTAVWSKAVKLCLECVGIG
jgi:hypothetical protein